MIGLVLGLVTATAYGASDFVGGLASRRVPALHLVLLSYPSSAVILAVLAVAQGGAPTLSALLFGAASGLAMAVATWWLYIALASGPMTIVSPLTSIVMSTATVSIGRVLGERISWLAYLALAVGAVAVILVGAESSPSLRGGQRIRAATALYAAGAGAAFAVSFLFIHQVSAGTGLYPLVAGRVVATLVVVVMALITGQFVLTRNAPVRLALLVAALDVVANIAMLYAFRHGLLSVVSVVISLHPAVTVILAVVLLREGLRRRQLVGLGLALASIAAISAAS